MLKRGATLAESQTGQESNCVYRVFQWKYNIDASSPWWRKLYFHVVWLPFARFSYLRIGVVPFERLEPDGSLSWKEDQGYFTEEWQAAQCAAKYKYGGYNAVSVNTPEKSDSCAPRVRFPASPAERRYEKRGKRRVELDLAPVERLQQVVEDAQRVVNNFRQQHQHSRPQ